MRLSSRTVPWIVIGTVAAAAVVLLSAARYERKRQVSLENGQFEAHYISAVEKLSGQMQGILRKRSINIAIDGLQDPEPAAPAAPAPEVKPSIENLKLSGIYWSPKKPMAQINGTVCRPGDIVGGFTVERIDSRQVVLRDPDGNTQTLGLYQGF